MVAIPSSATEVLSGTSPIVGSPSDPEPSRLYLAEIERRSAALRDAAVRGGRMLAEMTGQSVLKISQRAIGTAAPAADDLESSARRAGVALGSYMDAVEDLHARARSTEETVEGALAAIRAADLAIAAIAERAGVGAVPVWREAPPLIMPESQGGDSTAPEVGGRPSASPSSSAELHARYGLQWTSAAERWQRALEDIVAAETRWANLVEDRLACERALVSALAGTTIGELLALGDGGDRGAGAAVDIVGAALSGGSVVESAEVRALLRGGLSPEEVAELWDAVERDGGDTDRLLEEYCFELANLNGLPFGAMDRAARTALSRALSGETGSLREAYRRMGFLPGEMSLQDFLLDLSALQDALVEADATLSTKHRSGADRAQLVAFGRHDGAITGGISLGDLDGAAHVGVLVSGMRSSVQGIGESFEAFQRIRGRSTDCAMVTWIGYRSPGILAETTQTHADRGAVALTEYLDGFSVRRREDPVERFAVIGHSYGSNVIAEALKRVQEPVDAYVTLGSAGLRVGTSASDLKTEEIHATQGPGDDIAGIGRSVHFRSHAEDGAGPYAARVNPVTLDGAREVSAERLGAYEAVTMHNLRYPIEWGQAQWLADRLDGTPFDEEVGYLHPDSRTVHELTLILEGGG